MKILLYFLLLTLLLTGVINAEIFDRDETMKKGIELGANDINLLGNDKFKKEANELYDIITNTVKPRANEIAETISFDNSTGVVHFNRTVPKNDSKKLAKNMGNILRDDERIYIFISSSIPIDVLKRYATDIDLLGIGKNTVFILRGCIDTGKGVGGCGDFKATVNFFKSFAEDKKDSIYNVQIWIDPTLFKKYSITSAPTFVYAEGITLSGDIGSEGSDQRLISTPKYSKSLGDWSFDYHLRELQRSSNSNTLKNILEGYTDEKD